MALATLFFFMGRNKFVHIPARGRPFLDEICSREGLNAIAKLAPVVLFVGMFWCLFDQTASTFVFQAERMDRNILWFEVLPSQIQAFNPFLILVLIPLFTFVIYPTVEKLMGVYVRFGFELPAYEVFELGMDLAGKVLVMPPMGRKHNPLADTKGLRRAMFSGWGIDPSAKYRYGVDEVFPLSDHAGYTDLVEFVRAVDPVQVLTTHGYVGEFARDLRRLGIEAWSLKGTDQLELGLDFD